MSVVYSDEFESDLTDLESCTIHLALCDKTGQIDTTERDYQIAALDHLTNTYDVSAEEIRLHVNELASLWRGYDEQRADKYTETLKELFRESVCEECSATV